MKEMVGALYPTVCASMPPFGDPDKAVATFYRIQVAIRAVVG